MDKVKFKMIESYLDNFPEDASAVIVKYPVEDIALIIQTFSSNKLVPLLNVLPEFLLAEAIKKIDNEKIIPLLNLMQSNLVSRVLRKWRDGGDEEKYKEVFRSLNRDVQNRIMKLLAYSKDSVGFMMNPTPLAVSPDLTIKEVLIILGKEKNRYSRYIYVVDSDKKLIGVLPFKDAFYSTKKDELISKSMATDVFSISPITKASTIYTDKVWSKWDSLPVVDHNGVLLGVLKYEVLEEYYSEYLTRGKSDSVIIAGEAFADLIKIGFKGAASLTTAILSPGVDNEKNGK